MAGAATLEKPAAEKAAVQGQPKMKAAVTSAKKPDYVEGRRDFFKYRDLGVTGASEGWMRVQVMSAVRGMTQPTGWHYHVCEGQFVYALKGFVELEFEDGTQCRLEPGIRALSGRHEAQRDPHLGRCRDSRSVPAGDDGDGALRPAGQGRLAGKAA